MDIRSKINRAIIERSLPMIHEVNAFYEKNRIYAFLIVFTFTNSFDAGAQAVIGNDLVHVLKEDYLDGQAKLTYEDRQYVVTRVDNFDLEKGAIEIGVMEWQPSQDF